MGFRDLKQYKLISDYRVWKKNALYLYDVLITAAIPWPSLSVQWFPDVESVQDTYKRQRLLLGTRTSGQAESYLRLASVDLPDRTGPAAIPDVRKYDAETGEIGGYASNNDTKVAITQRVDFRGDLNRARYMPENPNILAAISDEGGVYIFDVTKHSMHPTGVFKPEMVLEHHTQEGWGISWSSQRKGVLASCSIDGSVAVWDVNKYSKETVKLSPTHKMKRDTAVNEVRFHASSGDIIGSAGDDGRLTLHDLRSAEPNAEAWSASAPDGALNTVAFNPANAYLVAAGSGAGSIHLFDIRGRDPVSTLSQQHTDSVTALEWSPTEATVAASGGADGRVLLWDFANAGEPPHEDGKPSELLFVHAGHTAAVNDVAWNPAQPWMLASVADDSHVEVWRPASTIVGHATR